MNESGSDRWRQINSDNLNKPMRDLVCPRCEAQEAKHDREEHPSVFECGACGEVFLA